MPGKATAIIEIKGKEYNFGRSGYGSGQFSYIHPRDNEWEEGRPYLFTLFTDEEYQGEACEMRGSTLPCQLP